MRRWVEHRLVVLLFVCDTINRPLFLRAGEGVCVWYVDCCMLFRSLLGVVLFFFAGRQVGVYSVLNDKILIGFDVGLILVIEWWFGVRSL